MSFLIANKRKKNRRKNEFPVCITRELIRIIMVFLDYIKTFLMLKRDKDILF